MKILFDSIPLDKVSVSMTMNGAGRFSPLFLRFSRGKCRNCPLFRAFY